MGPALIQTFARVLSVTAVLSLPSFFFGCTTPPGPPEPSEATFVGPEISQGADADNEQVLVAQLPSPGWQFTLDATREAHRRTNVFVTLRKPNPAFVYPQVIVTQRLATTVRPAVPIAVYARILEFEDRSREAIHERVSLAPSTEPPPAETPR